MPFKKGDTNINKNGRPKTSYSIKLRQTVTEFCEDNALEFLTEIKKMKQGHAKAQAFIALLNFCLPKLTEANSKIDIENLTNDELDKLLQRVTETQ